MGYKALFKRNPFLIKGVVPFPTFFLLSGLRGTPEDKVISWCIKAFCSPSLPREWSLSSHLPSSLLNIVFWTLTQKARRTLRAVNQFLCLVPCRKASKQGHFGPTALLEFKTGVLNRLLVRYLCAVQYPQIGSLKRSVLCQKAGCWFAHCTRAHLTVPPSLLSPGAGFHLVRWPLNLQCPCILKSKEATHLRS